MSYSYLIGRSFYFAPLYMLILSRLLRPLGFAEHDCNGGCNPSKYCGRIRSPENYLPLHCWNHSTTCGHCKYWMSTFSLRGILRIFLSHYTKGSNCKARSQESNRLTHYQWGFWLIQKRFKLSTKNMFDVVILGER